MKDKAKPLKKLRYGAICATIWRDTYTDPKGHSFETHNVVLDRAYKDKKGDWQHASSLRKEDLLKAALALQKAFEFLATHEDDESAGGQIDVEEERVR